MRHPPSRPAPALTRRTLLHAGAGAAALTLAPGCASSESGGRADGTPAEGGTARLNGKGELRTLLGPEVSVGLYDAVGVAVTFGPYLRGTVEGSKGGVPEGLPAADRRRGRWKLFGGVTLEGSLFAGLPGRIHGLPLPGYRHRIPIFNREWPIAAGRTPKSETLPLPAAS